MNMTGLNIEQAQEYNRDKETSEYLSTNQAKVDLYLPLKNAQTGLNLHIGELESLVPGKQVSTVSLTDTKEEKKHTVAGRYEHICSQAWAFCKVTPSKSGLLSNFL